MQVGVFLPDASSTDALKPTLVSTCRVDGWPSPSAIGGLHVKQIAPHF